MVFTKSKFVGTALSSVCRNGVLHGKEVEYYKGNIVTSCFYHQGFYHGRYLRLGEDGGVKEIANYSHGQFDGRYDSWYQNGNKLPREQLCRWKEIWEAMFLERARR